jgi:hypothetical protein
MLLACLALGAIRMTSTPLTEVAMSAQMFKVLNAFTTIAFLAAVGYAFLVADDLDLTIKIVVVAMVVSVVEAVAYRMLVRRD